MKQLLIILYVIVTICILASVSRYFGLTLLGDWNITFPITALICLLLANRIKKRQMDAK